MNMFSGMKGVGLQEAAAQLRRRNGYERNGVNRWRATDIRAPRTQEPAVVCDRCGVPTRFVVCPWCREWMKDDPCPQ